MEIIHLHILRGGCGGLALGYSIECLCAILSGYYASLECMLSRWIGNILNEYEYV